MHDPYLSGPTLSDVIRSFGSAYIAAYGRTMPWSHRVALESLESCRTPQAGGVVVRCGDCGSEGYIWRSCRHRSCPKCNRHKGDEWLQSRRNELLPVPYFHVVFTVPEELRRIIRKYQRHLYPVLMTAAAETLKDLAADPKHMGGEIGIMSVLHTWTRTLEFHPHVHCLVPAGYMDKEGRWHGVNRPWLAPHKALADRFRGKLCAKMRDAVASLQLPGSVFHKRWVVHVDLPMHGRDTVLSYLSRYVHRGPMSESRLVSMNEKYVRFKYRDETRLEWKTMELRGHEFLRRYLQHVTPKGFHCVRYYGLWSKTSRPRLEALRRQLLLTSPEAESRLAPRPRKECRCHSCDSTRLSVMTFFRRGETPPPLRTFLKKSPAAAPSSAATIQSPEPTPWPTAIWVLPAPLEPTPMGQPP